MEPGAVLRDVAARFGVTKASLQRHIDSHPRAAASDVTTAPPAKKQRGGGQRAPSPPAAQAEPRNALVQLAAPPAPTPTPSNDESPATSRSEEIVSSRANPRGGDDLDDLMREIKTHLEIARSDSDATYAEKSSLIGKALSAIRLKKQLTGELGQTEAAVLASPRVRRLLADIIDALKPYPEASRAVLAKIEGTHGEVAA